MKLISLHLTNLLALFPVHYLNIKKINLTIKKGYTSTIENINLMTFLPLLIVLSVISSTKAPT